MLSSGIVRGRRAFFYHTLVSPFLLLHFFIAIRLLPRENWKLKRETTFFTAQKNGLKTCTETFLFLPFQNSSQLHNQSHTELCNRKATSPIKGNFQILWGNPLERLIKQPHFISARQDLSYRQFFVPQYQKSSPNNDVIFWGENAVNWIGWKTAKSERSSRVSPFYYNLIIMISVLCFELWYHCRIVPHTLMK